jgi:molybdopterin converting factor small subunit
MPRVHLTGSIRERAGGLGTIEVEAETVAGAVHALEAGLPALRGWVTDEQGVLRRHVKLFLGGRAVALETPIAPDDDLHIVAAISGG